MTWNFSRNTLLLVGGMSVYSFASGFAMPNFPLYVKVLGASSSEFGFLIFLRTATLALTMIPGGWFTDKFGPKRALIITSWADLVSWLILGITPTWSWIGLYTLLAGVSGGFGTGAWYVILANENPSQEGTLNISAFALGILPFIIPDAAGSLTSIGYFKLVGDMYTRPILSTTFRVGFFCMLAPLGFYLFIRPLDGLDSVAPNTNSFSSLLTRKNLPFVGLLLSNFLMGLGGGMILDFFPLYFVERFQVTPSMNSLLRFFSALMIAVSVLAAPRITKKLGPFKTVFGAELLTIPSLVLLALEKTHFWRAAAAFLLRGALIHVIIPVLSTVVMGVLHEAHRGKGGGVYELSRLGGYMIAAPVSGRWIQKYGFTRSFYVAAVGYWVSAIVFYGAMRTQIAVQGSRVTPHKLRESKV